MDLQSNKEEVATGVTEVDSESTKKFYFILTCVIGAIVLIIILSNPANNKSVIDDTALDASALSQPQGVRQRQHGQVAGAETYGPLAPSGGIKTTPSVAPTSTEIPTPTPSSAPTATPQPTATEAPTAAPTQTPSPSPTITPAPTETPTPTQSS